MWSPPWWKPDGLLGIAGDRNIMDALYDIKVLSSVDERICEGWLNIVKKCLFIVGDTSGEVCGDKRHYLDYLRWNQKEIFQIFEKFSRMIDLKDLHPDVHTCELSLRAHFCLSEADKGLIHENERSYNKAMTLRCTKVTLHTAGRFVNVIDLLCRKGITDSSTYDIVDIDKLRTQGQDLQSLLPAFQSINSVFQQFQEFIVQDWEAKAAQDDLMMTALGLAQARSLESHLKRRFRQIREKAQFLEECLKRTTISAWSRFWYGFTHPWETVTTVWNWIKENPWKTVAIVASAALPLAFVGGVAVGLFASGMALEAIVGTETMFGALTTGIGLAYNTSRLLLSDEKDLQEEGNQELVPSEPTDKEGLEKLKREMDEAEGEFQSKLESVEEECLRIELEVEEKQARVKQRLEVRELIEKSVSDIKSLFRKKSLYKQ